MMQGSITPFSFVFCDGCFGFSTVSIVLIDGGAEDWFVVKGDELEALELVLYSCVCFV